MQLSAMHSALATIRSVIMNWQPSEQSYTGGHQPSLTSDHQSHTSNHRTHRTGDHQVSLTPIISLLDQQSSDQSHTDVRQVSLAAVIIRRIYCQRSCQSPISHLSNQKIFKGQL
jgi:hypothetical protein